VSTTTMNSARVVPSAEGFRANAEEHLGWARTAYTDREREIFVQMGGVASVSVKELTHVRLGSKLRPPARTPQAAFFRSLRQRHRRQRRAAAPTPRPASSP